MEKKKRLMALQSTRELSAGRLQLRGLRLVAVLLACFVLPCLLLVVLQPNMGAALSVLTLQSTTQTRLHIQVQAVEAEISGSSHRPVAETRILVKEEDEEKQTNSPSAAAESANEISPPLEENKSIIESFGSANVISSPPPVEENKSMEAVAGTKNLLKEEDKESQTSNLSPETANEISPPVEEKKTMEPSESTNAIISPTVEENKSIEEAMHTEETKVQVSDQETKIVENVAISEDAPVADAELNSSTHQEKMKSPVSDETGTEEKDTAVMDEPNVDSTELNSSTHRREETKLPVPNQETGSEETNTIIFGETTADNTTETNSSTPQEVTETQNAELVSVPLVFTNMQSEREENVSVAGAGEAVVNSETEVPVEKQDSSNSTGNLDAEANVHCDFSQERSDTCSVRGDVRVDGRSSSITVASQSVTPGGNSLPTAKIRPYSRKWEPQLMDRIREFSVKTTSSNEPRTRCTVTHTAPAVLFSTGGFVGNFFHDFTDVLVPLFITSRQYQGEVHFLVSDFNHAWISKYSPILGRLSRHRIINADDDEDVHCFPQVHVGLLSHKELGVDPSKAPNGYSVGDFRELLRSSYSLRRKSVGAITGRKPRLLILLRKGSRAFANARRVVSMGKRSGFKVVAAGPEEARDVPRFARVVNSCDVMMGVHGAGLTNMVFLPEGASVIQVLPWGGLHYACWHDFGAPAPDMGLRYFEYDIAAEESSLAERYSRDDPVFTDPLSIHRGGFGAVWSVFLRDQTVKLDVARFRTVLQEALRAVVQK
ncbi:uncharacterized protein M6B38_107475 [Iris pallida]|uniref:Glycosyltransferase 61 catalytic domain-containing protein n=1 Tax=Iris pallida TaxID=29817 RepID=A0AAX6EGZ9_IRIPA|nr:uncharacterized protein M6B38_107475 [Iris pallida]